MRSRYLGGYSDQPGQFRRLHQKLCVVDQRLAFVGGINFLDDRLDVRHGWCEAPRLDYAVELAGPVVLPIEQTVRALWTRATFGRDWRDELAGLARSAHPVAEARRFLQLLSGRRHQVITGVCLVRPDGKASERLVSTVLAFQRLTEAQIAAHLEGDEWRGVAGGYQIQNRAEAWVRFLSGSHSNVVGLPLFETAQLLRGAGWLRP